MTKEFPVRRWRTEQDVVVRFDKPFTAAASVLLVPHGDLIGSIVLLSEDWDPVSVDAVRFEDIL